MPPDLPLHWLADSLDRAVNAITFSPHGRVALLEADDYVDRRGKHGVVARVVERPRIAEGMIDA
jgi:hypothetical protein